MGMLSYEPIKEIPIDAKELTLDELCIECKKLLS